MNVLSATGNLGQDCKTNTVGGTSVCNFSVAMKSGYGDKAQTVWLDCSLWGKAAEGALPQYLVKGQQVGVSGELSTYETENGKTYLKLRCNSVDLLGSKGDSASQPSPAPSANKPKSPPAPSDGFDDDSIPF